MRLISLILIILSLFACKKDDPDNNTPNNLSNGILVLNEGLFQQNNSSLAWIDLSNSEVTNDVFLEKNNRLLGDTGNDMEVYGNKIYIVVNGSNTIEVINKQTGKSIKQINMMNGSLQKSPRSIAFHGSKAFITCYDGFVDVMDTATLTISQRISVGSNPEDLAVSNGKLYVSNSGGLNYPNVDSTVSIISLSNLQHLGKITVGKNPGKIIADSEGDIYVIVRGNYGTIPARLVKINTLTDTKDLTFNFDALGIERMNEHFLITYYDYSSQESAIRLFDPLSEQLVADPFFHANEVQTLYGIKYDPYRNKIYCLDAMGFTNSGYVRKYSANGSYESSFHVGLNPNNLVIYE
jgi:hypothetical protein